MTGEADRRWSKLQAPPMVSGGGGGDSGREEAGLEFEEGGGGAEEGSCARNRGLVGGGGRSTVRGSVGAGARAPLGSGRKEEEERIDEWVPRHPDKYLGDASRTVRRHLADCPRGGCYNPTP